MIGHMRQTTIQWTCSYCVYAYVSVPTTKR